jgi:bifunctional non-homologous end joining protein LigD
MAKSEAVEVQVDDRTVRLTNLDKVLYPATGFTKGEVIDYYARIAPAMLPHIDGRALTFRRYPNGVDEPGFFEKNCPGHRPAWMDTAAAPGGVNSCLIDHPAGLVWAGNQAAIEIHVPMAKAIDLANPTILAFDLDPGPPADVLHCARVAIEVRAVLETVGLEGFVKTSGSKGLQLYVPLNTTTTHEHASSFALAVGQLLARQAPDRVLVEMTRALRPGKVFIDWSQNSFHKTTIGPYSLRARDSPTVSTPLSWDELSDALDRNDADALVFEAGDVLERVTEDGDLFAPVQTLEQELPAPGT